MLVIVLIALAIALSISGAIEGEETKDSLLPIAEVLKLLIAIFLTVPMGAGIWMLAIKHCAGIPVAYTEVFKYFKYWWRLAIFPVIPALLKWIGYLGADISALIPFVTALLTIFFAVSYFMFVPL